MEVCDKDRPLGDEFGRDGVHAQPKKILHLTGENDDGDSAGEADNHRVRDKLDGAAKLRDAEYNEDDARHHRCYDQTVDTVSLHNAVHDYNECAGRPADLDSRAAERG